MRKTVKELREMLEGLPDNLLVQFYPIAEAWLGSNKPLRAVSLSIYDKKGEDTTVRDAGAEAHIFLHEEVT